MGTMKSLAIGLVAGAVAVLALVYARPGPPARPFSAAPVRIDGLGRWEMGVRPTAAPASKPATRPWRDPLDAVVEDVDCRGVAFGEFIDWLRETTGANIIVNWLALESAGVDKSRAITLQVRRVAARRVLDLALAGTGATAKLEHRSREDVVTVSTREDLDKERVTKVYDVRDLMVESWRFSRKFGGAEASGANGNGPGTRPGRVYVPEVGTTEFERAGQIVRAIEESVEPVTWRENGGTLGSIRYWAGRLIITQTEENQENVEALLRKMRGQGE